MRSLLRRDAYARWMLLVVAIAFAVRAAGIWPNLPDVPDPDEHLILWPPLRMAHGTWQASSGYPPLHMYVMLGEYAVFYGFGSIAGRFAGPMDFARQMITDPTPLYLLGRATSVLFGVATIVALYAVGRRLYDARVGLAAAAFLAFDTVHVYASQVIKNDVLMAFLLVLSFWFACGILRQGRTRDYVLAGLLTGLAAAAKYNAAIGVLVIIAAHLLRSRDQQIGVLRALLARPLWLAGLAALAGFLVGYPHLLLDPAQAWQGLQTHSVDFFWAWLGWESAPPGWIYYPALTLYAAWGIPLQLLALAALCAALIRHGPEDLLLSVMPLANYLVMGAVRVNQPRYFLLAMPFLLVLAAKLLLDGWDWVRLRLPARLRRVALPALVVLLLLWPAGMSVSLDYMLLQTHPWVAARTWLEENVPGGSRIVVDLGGPPLPASPESLLEVRGAPRGRFEEMQREVAASRSPSYWVLPIQHFIRGEPYLEGQEATVETMNWYREHGYEYIVTSSLLPDDYHRSPGVAERYPKTLAFYEALEQEGQLLAEFKPPARGPWRITYTNVRQIPTIRVYRLPPGGEVPGS